MEFDSYVNFFTDGGEGKSQRLNYECVLGISVRLLRCHNSFLMQQKGYFISDILLTLIESLPLIKKLMGTPKETLKFMTAEEVCFDVLYCCE